MMKVKLMKVKNDGNEGDDERGWRDDAGGDHDDGNGDDDD